MDLRNCGSTFEGVIKALINDTSSLVSERCLPWKPPTYGPAQERDCRMACSDRPLYIDQGSFRSFRLDSGILAIQRHIREWGSVMTQLELLSDFRAFFHRQPNGVYKVSKGVELVLNHAVVLVGYNNIEKYWIAKNSWGPNFAANGFFKVSFWRPSLMAYERMKLGNVHSCKAWVSY